MTLYVDTSALAKLYIDEADSSDAQRFLRSDPVLVTSWLTIVELRRTLSRSLSGSDLQRSIMASEADLDQMAMINPGERVWRAASDIAMELSVKSLDAIHLASARALEIPALSFCTFDLRLAQAARRLGFTVLGA